MMNLQQAILECTDYAIIATNSEGIIQTFNPAAQKMLGYTAEEVVNHVTPLIFHDPEELKQQAQTLSQALGREIAPGKDFIVTTQSVNHKDEWTFIRKDGSRFPVSLSVKPLCNDAGEIIGGVGIAKDITQQKQMEAQLHKNAANLAAAQRIAHLGSWELNLLTQEMIWSEEVFRIFGRNPESGTPTYDEMQECIHPDDRHQQDFVMQQAIAQGLCYELEYRCYRPDQSLRYVLSRGEVILDADGQPIQLIGIILDITERKQTEQQLRNLSDRLTLALKSADIGTWDWDMIHEAYWDDRMYELYDLQRSVAPATYQDWVNALHPDDRAEIETALQDAIQGKREFDVEFRIVRPDHSIRYIHASALVQRNQQGEAQRMVGINYDITERKQVESALRESEHRYATLTEAAPVAIFRLDTQGNCVYVNERWSEMTGRPTQAALGMGWVETLHPEHRHCVLMQWSQRGFSQPELYQSEGRHLLPDGSINWFYCHIVPETDSNGKIMGYVGTLTDITQRKQAEEQLHQLSQRLTLAIRSGGFGIWEYDFVQARQIWDERMYELYGVSHENFNCTFDTWLNCLHPDDRDHIWANIQQVLQNKQEYNVEFRIILPSGEIRYIKAYGLLNRDQQGQPLRMIGVNFDISKQQVALRDRQQAEQELIRHRDLREIIFNESTDALFLVDPATLLTLDCNRRAVELFEAANKAELLGIEGHSLQHRQFSPEEMAAIVAQMQTKGFWSQEIEYVTRQGKVFWGNIAAKPITIAGRTMNLVRVTDISEQQAALHERKQAEEKLRQTNEQLANANAELARATRLKDEFLANMSHELRTPLNAILGMSEGFEEGVFGAINEQQAKAIATIERSGRHLLELINDILDLSKIESGKLELQLSDIPIKGLCNTSLVFIKQMALKKNIRLITDIPDYLGSIQADDRRLRQVLINLLSNAVKFTPEGGAVKLKVWLEEVGEQREQREVRAEEASARNFGGGRGSKFFLVSPCPLSPLPSH
jgi:PAS domain S-box-containing protein